MDIGKWVIAHRLLKVDRVENLDVVAMLQKGVAALNHDAALGVSNHIGAVHLEKVWLQPKASFTRTRTADNQNILISGIGRIFRTVTHHQPLRFRQDHIVLELWCNKRLNNRIVCYDIKELGKQLKKIGMLVVQDQVWNRVTINRAAHKSTRYYIDEMHLLLKEEQTAAYTVEIWKRFRKWGGKLLCVLILHGNTEYAVLTEADSDSQDYQWERNGKGFAILIRVEVPV